MRVNNMSLYNKYGDTYDAKEVGKENFNHGPSKVKDEIHNTDRVTISSEALNLLSKLQDLDVYTTPNKDQVKENPIFDILKEIREQAENEDDPYKDLYRCIIIAMRIMRGDKVPQKDENFLAEKQPEMYLRAILMREERQDPKEYESILKDEKSKNPFESIFPSESLTLSQAGDLELSDD